MGGISDVYREGNTNSLYTHPSWTHCLAHFVMEYFVMGFVIFIYRLHCPNVSNPQAKADEYGCRLFDSVEELVASPDVDAIYVLTNMESHLQFAKLAMEAGKHVLVEKPVGCTLDEISEMQKLAEKNGVLCVPGHNYIHEPQIDRIKVA